MFLCDIGGIACALCVFALFAVAPGYVTAWLFNLFSFRVRSAAAQIAIAVPFSLALISVFEFLPWRFLSEGAVWPIHVVIWAIFAVLITVRIVRVYRRHGLRGFAPDRRARIGVAAACIWAIVAVFELADVRIDHRQYFPVAAYDYSARIPIASMLAFNTPRLPPATPFLAANPPAVLRYHYFWLMICGLVARLGHGFYDVRDAVIAGTVWSGIALLCVIALYLRFERGAAANRPGIYLTAFALLCVTGLDIIPTAIVDIVGYKDSHQLLPTTDWWNNQITGWPNALLWVPHNIAAFAIGVFSLLILYNALQQSSSSRRIVAIALSGVGLASALGVGFYVAVVIMLIGGVW